MSDEKNKAKVSNAPPPINPIRGSWSAPKRPSVAQPEWPKWLILGKVEVWEAAALSLNLDPWGVNQYDGGTFPSDDIFRDFEWRIRAVVSNELGGVLSRSDKLSLPVFTAWAVSKGISIPGELRPPVAEVAFGFPAQPGMSENASPTDTAESPVYVANVETASERRNRIKSYVGASAEQGRTKKSAFAELAKIERCSVDNIRRIYYGKDASR